MIPVIVPAETVGDETVRVIAWHVSNGERVVEDQPLVEVETSKAVLDIDAPSAGYVWHRCNPGDEMPVGKPICFITERPKAPALITVESVRTDAPARLTPQAARLARDLGLDISAFPSGTLVRSRDVLAEATLPDSKPRTAVVSGASLRWERLNKRKRAESHLLASGQTATIPSFITLPYPVTELRARLAERETASSISAIMIFEIARLLREYPLFNSVHSEGHAGFYEEVNIGWALDDGEGLVVPVIHNADRKNLSEIEVDLRRFSAAYVRNQLSAKDIARATFTISDLSMENVSIFLPLISRGQSAILGIGATTLTLAFDHQLAEGCSAARFLRDLIARLNIYDQSATRAAELCCSFCGGSAAELRADKVFLLRCELPLKGYVCSFCLVNY